MTAQGRVHGYSTGPGGGLVPARDAGMGQAGAQIAPQGEQPPPGLDIGRYYHDIRRLVQAHGGYRAAVRDGHDADDVLQAVFLGLLTRQHGRSPYDPIRCSLGRYVHLVAGCVVANFRRDHRKALEQRSSVPDPTRDLESPELRTVGDLVDQLVARFHLSPDQARALVLLADGAETRAVARATQLPEAAIEDLIDRVAEALS